MDLLGLLSATFQACLSAIFSVCKKKKKSYEDRLTFWGILYETAHSSVWCDDDDDDDVLYIAAFVLKKNKELKRI